ncbi:hypothetical protein PG985_000481 [Apiospora marii]|uniref:Importin N-terminal domain-containing protein n=1 Tax=Apiospora marii TaxID=335849 RepID=A0ABR1R2V6_9PEZI
MDGIPQPASIDEIENLVESLYQPNSPAVVSRIQESLQRLQKSSDGWQIADALLSRSSDNVKFFGALTFVVKLNTDTIDDDAARLLVQKLISWLAASLENGAGSIVIRKLCSALVTHYIHFSHLWPLCVRDLVYCLDLNKGDVLDDAKDSAPIGDIFPSLTPQKAISVAWFAAALAEEGEKIDSRSSKYIALHERLVRNSQDVATIVAISLSGSAGPRVQRDAIDALHEWMTYGERIPNDHLTSNLRPLLRPTIECLLVDDIYEAAIEILTDALNNWQSFFSKDDYDLLYSLFDSDWSQKRYQELVQGDFDFAAVKFGLLMIAFGDAQITELLNPKNERAQRFLAGLLGLLAAQGHLVAEDKIFVPALDFWATLIESMTDDLFSDPEQPINWNIPPLSFLMQVVSHCWRKIQYPHISVYNAWDSTERVGFSDARKDVCDLLQTMYTLAGDSLITVFVDLTTQSLSNTAWAELEAAAFCLGSLSDCLPDNDSCDAALSKVFGSQLFDLLRQGHSVVPVRTRQTCLSLIERYSEYFVRRAEFLPAALNLLFGALNESHLAGPSAKSIYRLCSSCRSILTPEVGAFLEQYGMIRNSVPMDSLTEERVVGAIASIIQAVPEEQPRLSAFHQLLMLIASDIEKAIQLKSITFMLEPSDPTVMRAFDLNQLPTHPVPGHEVALQVAVRALRCLLGAAKGLQSPSDTPINLDADETSITVKISPELEQIQTNIMSVLAQTKATFHDSLQVMSDINHVVRAGFSETEPGPFVFPPQMVVDLLTSPWQVAAPTAVNTAQVFLSYVQNGNYRGQMRQVIDQLLPWVISYIGMLGHPSNDPELAQFSLEFIQKAIQRCPDVLSRVQPHSNAEYIFTFAIEMLNGKEPLPKAAAADFWTSFITLKSDDEGTQRTIEGAMNQFGPTLAQSLIQNIGGNAARSELDKLSDPLKKLVFQNVHARQWLEAALNDDSFPSDKVTLADRSMFLKKITSLRGSRATNQVVKEFWVSCRGTGLGYTS